MELGKGDGGDLFGTARKELYFQGVHFLWVLHTRLQAEQQLLRATHSYFSHLEQKTYPFSYSLK